MTADPRAATAAAHDGRATLNLTTRLLVVNAPFALALAGLGWLPGIAQPLIVGAIIFLLPGLAEPRRFAPAAQHGAAGRGVHVEYGADRHADGGFRIHQAFADMVRVKTGVMT
jgi:hypothetical protein